MDLREQYMAFVSISELLFNKYSIEKFNSYDSLVHY